MSCMGFFISYEKYGYTSILNLIEYGLNSYIVFQYIQSDKKKIAIVIKISCKVLVFPLKIKYCVFM